MQPKEKLRRIKEEIKTQMNKDNESLSQASCQLPPVPVLMFYEKSLPCPCSWPGAAGQARGHHAGSDQFHSHPTGIVCPGVSYRCIFSFVVFFLYFLNALVWEYILVAKKLVSYCRLSESKDKATVKIACYFDSSHIVTINDIVYLYIFTLTNGV